MDGREMLDEFDRVDCHRTLDIVIKPGGGIRLIIVGSIYRWLVSKVAMKWVRNDVAWYLNNFSFVVRVSSGAEAILQSGNKVLSKRHGDDSLIMLALDLTNAFKFVDRLAMLGKLGVRKFSCGLNLSMAKIQFYRLGVDILCEPLECNKVTC